MKLTLFTVDEANRVIEAIRPQIERLVAAKHEIDELDRRVEVLALTLSGASADNPDALQLREAVAHRTRLAQSVRDGIEAIHARGAVVKDLSSGLVDFYSVAGDRLIFLCWKLGEPRVAHWHSLESGFAGRQPIGAVEDEE